MINISSQINQKMSAEEINSLAEYILDHRGQVDFGTQDLTVTPIGTISPTAAGIIERCSQGHITIPGAGEISDSDWESILGGDYYG